MKIEANQQIQKNVQQSQQFQQPVTAYTAYSASAAQVSPADFGASFEKSQHDFLVEQAGQSMKAQDSELLGLSGAAKPKDKLEILSDLVTERDLAALKKDSEDLEEEELDVIVTVMEKIKVMLATYCDDFDSGMVEDISDDKLKELSKLTGNAVHIAQKLSKNNLPVTEENVTDIAAAMDMAGQIGEVTDDAKEYCVRTNAAATIENLYLAMHSGTYQAGVSYVQDVAGYYTKVSNVSSSEAIQSLMPQVERLLAQEGMPVNKETLGQAQWLVERQLPVNHENLVKLQALEELKLPGLSGDGVGQDEGAEQVLDQIIDAMLEGKRPIQADMTQPPVLERSAHALDILQNATDEQVQTIVYAGDEVTIEALENVGQGDYRDGAYEISQEMSIELVTARRQLEEVRLQMTVQAGAVMLRNGISIETESLAQLIEHLQNIEDQYYRKMLAGANVEPSQTNVDLYREITGVTQGIGRAPAAAIGVIAFAQTDLSIRSIYTESAAIQERYRQANETYEAVMTRPRSDMGDSIQKAFRNVDDILQEMGIEVTSVNQRAVRILGYNSIEITQENIDRVKSADLEVTSMLENMKPKAVLQMIREGYNPLDKTAAQINEKLGELKAQTQEDQESFSEFLWNLEHTDSISADERSAYIGIYRLMHQVAQTDGAVVGALVEQGASLTMRNLMTGIRSAKHKDMDYKIGETGGVEGSKTGSITEQIEEGFLGVNQASYMAKLSGRIEGLMRNADWNGAAPVENLMNMSVEEFADYVQQQSDASEEKAGGYVTEQLRMLQQACQTEEAVLTQLATNEQPLTVANILAASELFGTRGKWLKDLQKYAGQSQDDGAEQMFLSEVSKLEEEFTDKNSAREVCSGFLDYANTLVQQGMGEEDITFEQMSSWKLLSSQIRLAGSMSEREEYYIPVEIDGEVTSVHVQFVHQQEHSGKVAVTLDTEAAGRIAAEFAEREGKLEGYVMAQAAETRQKLLSQDSNLRERISRECSLDISKLDYAQHEKLDIVQYSSEFMQTGTQGSISGSELYGIAKAVIGFVRNL